MNTTQDQDTKINDIQLATPAKVEDKHVKASGEAPRVVIIGAGFGGLQAAHALRNAPVNLTVIDRHNHHLFQPLLYQVATAGLSPADICVPIRFTLRKQKNTEVLLAEVTDIDVQEKRVIMGDRSIGYDYLIVATGARDNYFGHDDWEHFAPGLKSIEDSIKLRRNILLAFEAAEMETDAEKVKALLTFVLVGAGPTGVEMAGAIAELAHKAMASDFRHIDPKSARIILVEAGPRILPTFPEALARKAQRALNRLGVEVRTSAPVEAIDENGVMAAGKHISAKTVIWSAGVKASAAGRWLKAEVDRGGRVNVSSDLSLPGQPDIFVIGDAASAIQDGKLLPGVAPVAMQAGRYVAAVIAQRVAGKQDGTSAAGTAFHYHDKGNLATVGRSFAVMEMGKIRLTGFIAWAMWLTVHIFYLIGFRNRFLVFFQWTWAYFTFQRGTRLITFQEKSD
jgi:NADH:ubiquinone reductase (H+-translocating)